jgi:hypothetical protein
VQVELHPFNDRRLTRELAVLCQRVETARPQLPDGRLFVLHIAGVCRSTLATHHEEWPEFLGCIYTVW